MKLDQKRFYLKDSKEVLKTFSSNINGLNQNEADKRLAKYGLNIIKESKKFNAIFIFLKQFKSPLVYILIIAAIFSVFYGHMIDAYVILLVLLVNTGIGFFEEYKAEKSINALKKTIVSYAKVYRNNNLIQINSKDLVPGDVILLNQGDKVPGDARIIESQDLKITESSLTGESLPVEKSEKKLKSDVSLGDINNMIWMGTFVVSGSAKAVITSTGNSTIIGQIAEQIQEVKKDPLHFEKKTNLLARQMGLLAFIGALIVFLVGYFIRNFSFNETLLFTIAVLISAIPEGLPAVLAVVLAIGAYRMSKRNAIIRTLPATETLGVVDVILTDKTGTLTENTMNVEKINLLSKEYSISGNGWEPKGNFYLNNNKINPLKDIDLNKTLKIACLGQDSKAYKSNKKNSTYEVFGDPTEASLSVLCQKAELKKQNLSNELKKITEIPFNQELRLRANIFKNNKGINEIFVIGSPESVLDKSEFILRSGKEFKLLKKDKEVIDRKILNLTKNAMRVLALAYRETETINKNTQENIQKLVFVGLVGIRDPPRKDVKIAVAKAKGAGIKVIMATGDHKETALAIACEVGIISEKQKLQQKALDDKEISSMSDKELESALEEYNVFSRLTPKSKFRIAKLLQNKGHIVAMTGDGVNDGPALKKADIGISMGIVGTDVARESSDIVLTDDNFSSIINAIEEGRLVFNNTRQSSFFLITTNFAEYLSMLGALLIGLPLPLLARQLLWLNLVTDGVPNLALAAEPKHHDLLNEKPRNKNENILSKEIIPFLIMITILMVGISFFLFNQYLNQSLEKARTTVFLGLAFTQMFNAINLRSLKKSIFKIRLFSSKPFNWALSISVILTFLVIYIPSIRNAFDFVIISPLEMLFIISLSSIVFLAGEIYKFKINKNRQVL